MEATFRTQLSTELKSLNPADPHYASRFVDVLLSTGERCGASDLHLQPTADGLELRWRRDGVLLPLGTFPSGLAADVVTRLKVLADLLTYRNDVPQEGRIRAAAGAVEMRVSTFPTLHGEKAVVRLFGAAAQYQLLDELGLPDEVLDRTRRLLAETSGAILITGPAGSGKTTTLYACLRELVQAAGGIRNIVTLEDPVEVEIPQVAQSQVNEAAGFNLATGLRSILRQDPEVIMVGEIRDRVTAEVALQASLTGQLVLSSFHAGSAAGALSRLSDMGIEPYILRSGILAVISQRLVRRLCHCSRDADRPEAFLGLAVRHARTAVGCDECAHTGYRGRTVLAEMLVADAGAVGQAILARADAAALERSAVEAGMVSRWDRAARAIEVGITSPAEVRRVLGFSDQNGPPTLSI